MERDDEITQIRAQIEAVEVRIQQTDREINALTNQINDALQQLGVTGADNTPLPPLLQHLFDDRRDLRQAIRQLREEKLQLRAREQQLNDREQQLRVDEERRLLSLQQRETKTESFEYTWEVIVPYIDTVDLTKKGVVRGWRREDDITSFPNMYIRQELVEKKLLVDKFMESSLEKAKRLYVAGPPGCGKTSFFLLYCTQPLPDAGGRKPRVFVVQFRKSGYHEIMIVENGRVERLVPHSGTRPSNENLSRWVEIVLLREDLIRKFDYFVFDGVRQEHVVCENVLYHLNSNSPKRKGIHVTSLQFRIKPGEGTFQRDQKMHFHSWELQDYLEAFAFHTTPFMTPLQIKQVLLHEGDDDVLEETNDDLMQDVTYHDQNLQAHLPQLIERKYFYAGGIARFMFDFTLDNLCQEELPTLFEQMSDAEWNEFATLNISVGTPYAVNSLMQRLPHMSRTRVYPVSKFVLEKVYTKVGKRLLDKLVAAADNSSNPVLQGWVYELEQLDLLRAAIHASAPCTNEMRSLVLYADSIDLVHYDGTKLEGLKDKVTSFFIVCSLWNQGCFDAAIFHEGKLLTLQFTMSPKHTLKVRYIMDLKKVLNDKGLSVAGIHHIAIVKNDSVAEVFEFESPRYRSCTDLEAPVTVNLSRSSRLVKIEKGNYNTWLEEWSANKSLQLGNALASFQVTPPRRGQRKRALKS
jgi:hypothetical protein